MHLAVFGTHSPGGVDEYDHADFEITHGGALIIWNTYNTGTRSDKRGAYASGHWRSIFATADSKPRP